MEQARWTGRGSWVPMRYEVDGLSLLLGGQELLGEALDIIAKRRVWEIGTFRRRFLSSSLMSRDTARDGVPEPLAWTLHDQQPVRLPWSHGVPGQ